MDPSAPYSAPWSLPFFQWFSPHGGAVVMPMPYRIPAARGMADLRMAMVHDVVTERYIRHGPARDLALRVEAERRIAAAPEDLDAYDDAALAAERLGENATARTLLERKAELQGVVIPLEPDRTTPVDAAKLKIDLSEQDRRRYRTYANLGTVLVHGALPRVMAGDQTALPDARSGLACLYASVRIDPSAHFGRERWQIVLVEHLLFAAVHPDFLRRFDAVGERLARIRPHAPVARHFVWYQYKSLIQRGTAEQGSDARFSPAHPLSDLDARLSDGDRRTLRRFIAPLAVDGEWSSAVPVTVFDADEPFDQPVLGILGMWTLGAGANPHFALVLGTVMENVGQGSLAWECYERAFDLADRFSPDPETREWFRTHLRERQRFLAGSRGGEAWDSAMRTGFRQELATALSEREAFQKAEAQRIQISGQPMDAAADAAYWQGRPPLASSPGTADEWHAAERSEGLRVLMYLLTGIALGTGWGAFIAATSSPEKRKTPV